MLRQAESAHAAFEARVKAGAAAMRTAEAAAAAEAAEITHLKNVLNPAAAAEAHLAAETQKLNTWLKAGTISAHEHSAALKLIAADSARAAKALNGSQGLDSRGRPSLFGLKPYELQNLSFQINDVFTQLASGTSLTQTLAQQGGQIFQLFPKVGSAIAAGLTSAPVLGLTAALALMVVGIASAVSEAEKLRAIGGFLAANADGARISAEALKGAARELDQYGLSAEEALTVTKQFFNEGLDEEQIVQFGRAAKDMADIMGIDLKTAAGQVAAGFRGSFEELDKLIKSTRAFTPEQREQIRLFYEQGKATEGAALAMGIFSEKMGEGADQARSEWTSAIRDLGNAWSDFAEQLGKTQLAGAVISGLESDAKNLRQLAKLFGAPQYPNRQGSPDILAGATGDGTAAPTRTVTATAAQTNEAARLNEAVTARLALETKITSEGTIQTRLTALRSAEYLKIGASLTKADADAYVARVVDAERVKLAKELTSYRKQQADQAEREAAAQQTMVAQTLRLLQREEGFISKAKFDVNAFRVGFGSDTVTRKDGRVEAVTANTNGITRADAVRDLERRIAEFVNVVKGQIGSERFNSFSPSQQAGITSVAYNYGKLPERILAAARTGTSQELARAVRGLSGDNKGVNAARRNREADLIGVPNLAVEQSGAKAQQEAQDKQDKFNASLDEQIAKRTLDTTQLREQVGLQGDALIEAQKRAAVEDLIAKTIADAKKAGVDTTTAEFAARLEALRQVEQGYQDASRAREAFEVARANIDKPVSELSALRDSLRGQIDSLRTNGLSAEADALLPKLSAVNGQLREMIDNAIAAYQAMTPGTEAFPGTREELDAIISKFETLKLGTTEWVTIMGIGGQQIAQLFASTATNALDKFAQAVANGENVFGSLLDAFRQFAAEFLRQIAQMIIQQIIFNLVSGILKSVAGGAVPGGGAPFGDGSNLTGGIIRIPGLHTGGIAGRDATFTRGISPAWFTNAAHYHTGGIAGLKPDEVPAILRRGEEVLTEADPRHRANGGGGGGAPNIKIVNAIDAGDFVSKGLSTRTGEQALLNFIRANAGAVSSAMR